MKNLNQTNTNKWISAVLAALSSSLLLQPCTSALSQEITKPALTESSRSLKQLAHSGDATAQCELGRRYEFGIQTFANNRLAAHWYRLAANQGLAKAEYSLGRLYFSGEGVGQDQKEAVRYFRLAALQGYPLAQHRLARAYELGLGVPQDLIEACRWYRLAASENGLESSRINLEALLSRMGEPQFAARAELSASKLVATGSRDNAD